MISQNAKNKFMEKLKTLNYRFCKINFATPSKFDF